VKNKISDLNNYLFAQLERLDDEEISGEELATAIERGKAIAGVASQIIAGGNLQLQAMKMANEMGLPVTAPPALLQLTEGGVNVKCAVTTSQNASSFAKLFPAAVMPRLPRCLMRGLWKQVA